MDVQPTTPKSVNLMKKIIWAVLICLGIIIILFILAVIYSSFQKASVTPNSYYDTANSYGFAQEAGLSAPSSAGEMYIQKMARDEAIVPTMATPPTPNTIEQKVIKTGSLDIMVDEVEQTVSKITNETSALSGFVQNSSVNETTTGQRYANLVLRVPVKNFESLISKIKTFAKLVEREDINGQEVTQEYVDLQSSLTHNQAVEAQYLELLKRAQKVEEIIAVREKLDEVQAEIENLKGRIRYLDNQTEMSTISVNISSEAKVTLPAEKWQPWEIVKESVKKLIVSVQNFVNFIIVLIFSLIALIPYIILLLIIYLLAKWIYKKYKKPAKNL